MDALYFIKIIIEGRDDFTSKLSSATASLRAELAKLKGELKGIQSSYSGAGGGATIFSRASRNASDESRKAVQTYRDVRKEVSEVANAFRATERDMSRFRSTGSGVERILFRVGSAFRGAQRAIYDTQRGVRDMDFVTRKAEGAFFNLFYNVSRGADNFFKSFTRMNTIAAMLAPLIFTVVQAVLQLGAALVSVASAASLAAAALGGALLAGLMQLLPVVGLLVAAFHRLSLIFQANKMLTTGTAQSHRNAADAARAHREAIERLSDANWSLKSAYQNVKDQALDLKEAERNLIDVRRQAARDIVDHQNARIDAVLAEKDATLSLREAKLSLAELEHQQQNQTQLLRDRKSALSQAQRAVDIAREQGDPAQLSVALQQLGIAQANVSAIQSAQGGLPGQQQQLAMQRAKLGVQEAAQRRKESEVTLARAIDDANRAEKRGVEGAPSVISARRQIRNQTRQLAEANHSLAKSLREVHDAESDLRRGAYPGAGLGKQSNTFQNLMGRLDPTEKDTLRILREFQKLWNKATQPLTDAIVAAVGKALKIVEGLFRDKRFMASFQHLANVIGDQIVRFAKFLTSPAQKKFFEQFTDLAAKNLPKILTIFEKVFTLVEKIALAFAPVFEHILGGTNRFLTRQNARADQPASAPRGFQQNRLGAFAANSEKYLDSLAHFFGSLFHFLGAVISVAAGPGKNALDEMAKAFDRWATELKTTKKEGATQFFQNAVKASGQILRLFGMLIGLFFKLASGSGFENFLKVLQNVGIPALATIGAVYGKLFDAVAKAANNPFLGKLLELFLAVYGISKLTPLGMLTHTVWHSLVLAYLNRIAVNTGGGGIISGLLGKNAKGEEGVLATLKRSPILTSSLVVIAAALGVAIGGIIYKFLPKSVTNAIGGTINSALNWVGLGVHMPDENEGDIRQGASRYSEKNEKGFQYLLKEAKRFYARTHSVAQTLAALRKAHPGYTGDKDLDEAIRYAALSASGAKSFKVGGEVGGQQQRGGAVPIIAHVGEWVVNYAQQVRLAQMLRKPVSWIKSALFGGFTPSQTTFGGRTRPMLADWNDKEYDAGGNLIYGGTEFVETPLGQWVQVARATLAKMQRQPGWLPKYLLNTPGFRGASREQLQSWASKFYKFNAGGSPVARAFATGGVVMPSFAAGGVVTTTPSAGPTPPAARGVNQEFQIVTRSPHVDIDYVMRVAKVHAEASL